MCISPKNVNIIANFFPFTWVAGWVISTRLNPLPKSAFFLVLAIRFTAYFRSILITKEISKRIPNVGCFFVGIPPPHGLCKWGGGADWPAQKVAAGYGRGVLETFITHPGFGTISPPANRRLVSRVLQGAGGPGPGGPVGGVTTGPPAPLRTR